MANIMIASNGCWHSNWENTFYPDDLPEDWRFSYYSNEFSALFLRYREWSTLPRETLEAWMEDCDPHFQFLLELDLAQYSSAAEAQLQILQPQLALLVLRGSADEINAASKDWETRIGGSSVFADPMTPGTVTLPRVQYVRDPAEALEGGLLYLQCPADNRNLARYLQHVLAQQSGALVIPES